MGKPEETFWRCYPVVIVLALSQVLAAQDCNGNGVADAGDIAAGASADCNANEIPDECDVAAVRIGYSEPRRFPTRIDPESPGISPNITRVGDFDGDGDLDLVVLHEGQSTDWTTGVFLLRNAGDGTFAPPELILRGRWLAAMVSPDIDGDGDLDLVVSFSHWQETIVRVYYNRGDGTFDRMGSILQGQQIAHLVAADLDGDGDPDIVGTNYCTGADTTCPQLLFNEDGVNFTVTTLAAVDSAVRRLTIADIDDDGRVDVLVTDANARSYWLFLNEGDGEFLEPTILNLGAFDWRPIPVDLEGDDDTDLVIRGNLLFNRGGLFDPPVLLDLRDQVYAAEDLDLDGDLDLLAAGSGAISLLLNDGEGNFDERVELPFDDSVSFLTAADVDGDGAKDLVAVLGSRNQVAVRLRLAQDVPVYPDRNANGVPDACEADCNRNGVPDDLDISSGTSRDCNENGSPDECDITTEFKFDPPTPYLEGSSASDAEAADFDQDGDLDLAVSVLENFWIRIATPTRIQQYLKGTIRYLENDGDGTFVPTIELDLGDVQTRELVAADFDTDGHVDLASLSSPTGEVFVLLDGPLGAEAESFPIGETASRLLAVDIDLDGDIDLLSENGLDTNLDVYLLRNRGNASFGPFETLSPIGNEIFATDLNGDRAPDLVAGRLVAGQIHRIFILLNDGAGNFSAGERVGTGRVLMTADLDGDGDIDLAGEGSHREDRQILWNDGAGAFTAESFPGGYGWYYPTVADLDGDGDVDLATGGLTILRNDGRYGWATRTITEENGSSGVVAADLNGDGLVDLALPEGGRNRLSVFLNRTPPAPSPDRDRDGFPDECAAARFVRADCNADGSVNVSDAACSLLRLFSGAEVHCFAALDSNGDAEVNLTDAVFLLEYLFSGGQAPVEPFPDCGSGGRESDERLGCEAPLDCA